MSLGLHWNLLSCEHEPKVQTQTFFGLNVFNFRHNVTSAPWGKTVALAACSGASLLSNQVVSQNWGHAACLLVRGETEMTSIWFCVFTKRMHQLLDTAVSKTSRVSFCSHSKPLSASPCPKAVFIWDCHWAYLNGFGFQLLFCACTLGHPSFSFTVSTQSILSIFTWWYSANFVFITVVFSVNPYLPF